MDPRKIGAALDSALVTQAEFGLFKKKIAEETRLLVHLRICTLN